MSDTLLLLWREYRSTTKLLDLLENQRVTMELDGPVDAEIPKDLADYFAEYPDQCHHPVENLLFRQLKKRDPQRAEDVQKRLFERAALAALTSKDNSCERSEPRVVLMVGRARSHAEGGLGIAKTVAVDR